MKTIFITIPEGATSKNVLRSDIFRLLKERGLRIVIFGSRHKKDYYQKQFASDNVIIEVMPSPTCRKLEKKVLSSIFENSIRAKAARTMQKNYLLRKKMQGDKRYIFYKMSKDILYFLSQFRGWKWFLRKTYLLVPDHSFKKFFDKYKPDLVFAANMVYNIDTRILKEAKKRKIFTIGMIKSWDNFNTKTFIPVRPNKLIVPNEIVAQDAIKFAGFKKENIFVSGFAQFDRYVKQDLTIPREEFLKNLGLDPGKKTLLFCVAGDQFAPHDKEVLEFLERAIAEGQVKHPCQVLVRFQPRYKSAASNIKKPQYLFLNRPGKYPKDKFSRFEFEEEDIIHLMNSTHHCDLCINTASTMTIEASSFGKPVINIAFDGKHELPYLLSVRRYYDYDHYENLVRTGGLRVAYSEKELVKWINEYLANPELDKEGREQLKREQCYKLDGKSGERIGKFILKFI